MGTYPLVDHLVQSHGVDTVVAALRPLLTDERAERIERVLDARLTTLSVVIENLHDPHNGAAAIRSLEAFGLTCLHVIEQAEPFRFSSSVTIGCEKWITIRRHPSVDRCQRAMREAGMALYATLPDAGDDIESVPVDRPLALVFGNEHEGLTDTAIAACDGAVRIPMYGFTQSFNLSVSVALTVQRLAARRRAAIGALGDLPGPERAFLRARWYALSVRGAEQVLTRYVSK